VNQDVISDTVAITRDFLGGIFNALVEGDNYNEYLAPYGTEWALLPEGKTFEEVRCSLRFCDWLECFAMYDVGTMLNKPGVVHLIEEDLYYNIKFTNWTRARGDTYYYRRLKEQPKGRRMQEGRRRTQVAQSDSATTSSISYNCNYYGECGYGPNYGIDGLGGGFQYVRDEFPIAFDDSLKCPKCELAKASPSVLTGPVDYSWQEVAIAGVTPDGVAITITAVGQDRTPHCNQAMSGGSGLVRPNAMGVGNSTVEVRRTITTGELNPFRYTIFFKATTEAGSCNGQVQVCSPPEGLECNDYSYYGYDATATQYCEYY
jgi:hypothetical protein